MERTLATPGTSSEMQDSPTRTWQPVINALQSFFVGIGHAIRATYRRARTQLSTDITPAIDVEKIARRLCIVDRAKDDGHRDLPPPDEEIPSGVQREVIAYFKDLKRAAHKQAGCAMQAATKAYEQLNDANALASLRDVPARYENKILRHISDATSRLEHAREREFKQQRHYEAFREKNKLERVATYPELPLLYYLVVPVLIAGLAAVLSHWVVPDSESSRLSISWMVAISTAVVLVPFVLGGLSLRALEHVDDGKYFAGWAGIVVVVGTIGILAFYADFHIAATLADANFSSRAAFDTLRSAPLEFFSGVASWTTFGLFGLMGLLAMFLGYRSDDIYPGYGAAQRDYYKAREDRERVAQRLRKRINGMIDDAVSEVTSIARGHKAKFRSFTSTARKAAQCPSILKEYDVELEDACNVVLDRYRVANSAARKTDVPLSFDEHVCFNSDEESAFAFQSFGPSDLDVVKAELSALESEADSVRKKLRTMNLHLIESTVGSQSLDDEE
ncbi:MAG: hypothetical protein HKN77_02255 [Woeseiaceae bacterium]|nr:hypothetical protein [Woeseiaceae bacterium]